jgi:hypothetical protein
MGGRDSIQAMCAVQSEELAMVSVEWEAIAIFFYGRSNRHPAGPIREIDPGKPCEMIGSYQLHHRAK